MKRDARGGRRDGEVPRGDHAAQPPLPVGRPPRSRRRGSSIRISASAAESPSVDSGVDVGARLSAGSRPSGRPSTITCRAEHRVGDQAVVAVSPRRTTAYVQSALGHPPGDLDDRVGRVRRPAARRDELVDQAVCRGDPARPRDGEHALGQEPRTPPGGEGRADRRRRGCRATGPRSWPRRADPATLGQHRGEAEDPARAEHARRARSRWRRRRSTGRPRPSRTTNTSTRGPGTRRGSGRPARYAASSAERASRATPRCDNPSNGG